MKLLMISPGKLPIPATRGGAVETLIETILKENEKRHDFDITLVGMKEEVALQKSKEYHYTNFIFIETDDLFYKISRGFRFLINKLPFIYLGNAYINRVLNYLDNEEYDAVIIENNCEYVLKLKQYKEVYLHLHNDFLNSKTKMAKKILNSYRGVFTISNYLKNRILEIDSSYTSVKTLYNGIDTSLFHIEQESKKPYVYLYIGRLVKEKGVLELIQAFKQLQDDSKLLIIGDWNVPRSRRGYVKKLKKEAKGCSNVTFLGYVPNQELRTYIKQASFGVVPSLWEEPFALTVVELMAGGLPVVARCGGAMEELIPKDCGLLYSDNQLLEALKIVQTMTFDKEKIINQAELFCKEIYYQKFCEFIEGRKTWIQLKK